MMVDDRDYGFVFPPHLADTSADGGGPTRTDLTFNVDLGTRLDSILVSASHQVTLIPKVDEMMNSL